MVHSPNFLMKISWGVAQVMDQDGCITTSNVTVAAGVQFQVEVSTTDSGCGSENGGITIVADLGVEPYVYSVDGNSQDLNSFAQLSGGKHGLVVTDAVNCQVLDTITIPSGVSFTQSIAGIVESKCAISLCHVSDAGLPDFTIFAEFQSRALGVKTRTQSGDMPRTGSLSQEEKDLIACWVDDGALDN